MPATPRFLDMAEEDTRPTDERGKLLTPKQIRARARRRQARGAKEYLTTEEFEALYKPVEQWDMEELANGRPRNARGKFDGGPKPRWIDREVSERATELFHEKVRGGMNGLTVSALATLQHLVENEGTDNRGRPLVPATVKAQVSQFLLEHVVGKPKQRIESDISVKLQAILGVVMANPNEALSSPAQGGQGYSIGHLPGVTLELGSAEESDEVVEGEIVA